MPQLQRDDDAFGALAEASRVHFGPKPTFPPWGRTDGHHKSPDAARALAELADEHALHGLAANDVAMTMVKMLALCTRCGSQAAVPAATLDVKRRWFHVSLELCGTCFTEYAVDRHGGKNHAGAFVVNESARARAMNRDDAIQLLQHMVQRGVVRRPLKLSVGVCRCVLQGHPDISAAALSSDQEWTVTGSWGGTTIVWNARTGERRSVMRSFSEPVTTVAYSPDGATIAVGSGCAVNVWDAASGECLRTLRSEIASTLVLCLSFAPDGATIVAGFENGLLRVLDTTSGECLRVLEGHMDLVNTVQYSPSGSTIASGSEDGTAAVWDAASGRRLRVLEGHTNVVYAVAYSPDGGNIATGSTDLTARLWNPASGECRHVLYGHAGSVDAVAFSPNGAVVATGSSDETVRLWDVASGACRHVVRGDLTRIVCVSFSRGEEGKILAVGCDDETLRLWDDTSGIK